FDHNPEKVGQKIGGQEIHNLDDLPRLLQEQNIKMAVIAVPARGAQQVADALVEAGVLAILNYAPIIVQVPPHIKIRHIDAVVALQSMTYYLENAAPSRAASAGSPEA
ncbi:MAG TPA: redox-sensing transcriptional repressor Rex, partial [Chloroflexia bacterium]|nr:redox-sensing transcriptional repressor Rex [Chloroflexia bacterium]